MSSYELSASSATSTTMASTSSSKVSTKNASINITLDHLSLLATDPSAIRHFLRKYDQYSNEVKYRARQLSILSTKAAFPVDLKFCVDVDFLESSMALGFIKTATSYDDLTEDQVRKLLDNRAKESKDVVTLEKLDAIVSSQLRKNMRNNDAIARMQDLFAIYHMVLRSNGLKWIIEDNQKVAVKHVISAVQTTKLKERLVADLAFSHHPFFKDFKGFLKHTLRLDEAFQLVDAGPPKKKKKINDDPQNRSGNTNKHKNKTHDPHSGWKGDDGKKKPAPLCSWEPDMKKGIRHFLKECPDCPEVEKNRLLDERAKKLAEDGSARGTRFSGCPPPGRSTGRLQQGPVNLSASPSCPIVVSDGLALLNGTGRCDDGRDDSIASPVLAQNAVLKGIGRVDAIKPVSIQVALTNSQKVESFTFSRVWQVPRLVMELSAGRLALTNVSFLVADDDLACEDLLLGLPVLRHLGIHSRTLLERNCATLDGTNCSAVAHFPATDRCGSLGRLMVAHLGGSVEHEGEIFDGDSDAGVKSEEAQAPHHDPSRPRHDYFVQYSEDDPFPDPNLIGLPSSHVDVSTEEIQEMLNRGKGNGFPASHVTKLEKLVWEHPDVFSTEFQRVPAKIYPLRIELTADAQPIRVKLRNYSQSQRQFMTKMTDEYTAYGLIFPNLTSKWACAPLLVPKPGPAESRFTVDLKPVNQFTKPYQLPMPIVEQELIRLAGSKFFANLDFAHGYWQMPLHPDSLECQSFVTHENVFTPTRVLHGTTNAVLHLQSFLAMHLHSDLKNRTLLWVDDSLFFNGTIDQHLADIEAFLKFCASNNWKLHPRKCTLFAVTVKWCG